MKKIKKDLQEQINLAELYDKLYSEANKDYDLSKLIVIPTGDLDADIKRTEKAMDYYLNFIQDNNKKPKIMVVGNIQRDKNGGLIKNSQQYNIYKNLRINYGLRPMDLRIEGNSNNTLENMLYLLDKIRNSQVKSIFISTNPSHYERFKLFEKEAKKEGIMKEDVEIYHIPTENKEPLLKKIKGEIAYLQDYFILKFTGSLNKARGFKHKKVKNLPYSP
ncbi:DUF218 domain-containing protein [Candidatus Woesearchaeota archaeon]|jgi:uncharacterized SAM-binding protein YcdF (DUF218 family)|nr:DUF218 domain-containing protein [Candidatus Woesearchaeota archaeon]